jgi:hypothetical protein
MKQTHEPMWYLPSLECYVLVKDNEASLHELLWKDDHDILLEGKWRLQKSDSMYNIICSEFFLSRYI